MPATVTPLGPGLVTIGTSPLDFSCEVVGASITHEYEETSERRVRLCGDAIEASEQRVDGFTASVENDLLAGALYDYLQANDLTVQDFTFQPNTQAGSITPAEWSGQVVVRLPGSIGSDEYGSPIASDIEWKAAGNPATFAWQAGADA